MIPSMKTAVRFSTCLLTLLATGRMLAAEITVFAAASLTDSMKEIGTAYEKETGEKVRFNFAASNTLAQQIEAGAPADIFFSADEAKMNTLQSAGLIVGDTRRNVLGNSLVLITAKDGPGITREQELTSQAVTRISIADPEAVPAGIYAKAWLKKIALWDILQPKIVPGANVRAAMAVVESGNAEAGIVYKTDAAISDKVRVAYKIPANEVPDIIYPAAITKDSRNAQAARKFLDYLEGEKADRIFVKFGFSLIN